MKRTRILLVPGLLLLMLLTGCVEQRLSWNLNYDQALERAKKENKSVMIDFTASWCPPCRMMDQKTFRDAEVRQFLMAKTIPIKIDVDEQPHMKQQFGINAVPTFVFVDADGKELGRSDSFQPPARFLSWARRVVP